MCIATAAALNKQFQNEPMKFCVTPGLAKSEVLSEVVMYLVRVTQHEILTNSMEVKGTGSWCVLVEYIKENYYARFHDPSYHRYRERLFSVC